MIASRLARIPDALRSLMGNTGRRERCTARLAPVASLPFRTVAPTTAILLAASGTSWRESTATRTSFSDVDSIAAGQDFRVAVREYIDDIDVMLALIGPRWEPSRLAASNDFVRTELVEALRMGKPVIPILIDNTQMPTSDELPEDLNQLAFLNALVVRPDPDFRGDAARVARAIRVAPQAAADVRQRAQAREREREAEADLANAEAATASAARAAAEAELTRVRAERASAEQARLEAEAETERLRETERERALADALLTDQSALAAQLKTERLRAQHAEVEKARRLADARDYEVAARAKAERLRRAREVAEQQAAHVERAVTSESGRDDSNLVGQALPATTGQPAAENDDVQEPAEPVVALLAGARAVGDNDTVDDQTDMSRQIDYELSDDPRGESPKGAGPTVSADPSSGDPVSRAEARRTRRGMRPAWVSRHVLLTTLGFVLVLTAILVVVKLVNSEEGLGDGGLATETEVHSRGIAIDEADGLLVSTYSRVRRVAPDGIIDTVAGTGDYRFNVESGPATEVNFGAQDIALDPDGALYLADITNHRIRKLDTNGSLTTFAGGGSRRPDTVDAVQATEADLFYPEAVATDRLGNVYFCQFRAVFRVAPSGLMTKVAGNGTDRYEGDGSVATKTGLDRGRNRRRGRWQSPYCRWAQPSRTPNSSRWHHHHRRGHRRPC